MTRLSILALFATIALVAAGGPAAAVELKGQVVEVAGGDVRIEVEGDLLPQVGDPVRIALRIPGGPEVTVAQWRVSAVEADGIRATVVEATGTPAVGQVVTITAENPTRVVLLVSNDRIDDAAVMSAVAEFLAHELEPRAAPCDGATAAPPPDVRPGPSSRPAPPPPVRSGRPLGPSAPCIGMSPLGQSDCE